MTQFTYKGIVLKLIKRHDYHTKQAMRYTLGGTNQNVWIPKKHLDANGNLLPNENIDYVLRQSQRQLDLAGYTEAIPGIKKWSSPQIKKPDYVTIARLPRQRDPYHESRYIIPKLVLRDDVRLFLIDCYYDDKKNAPYYTQEFDMSPPEYRRDFLNQLLQLEAKSQERSDENV